MTELPSHCWYCGVYLQGGATIHLESCPWYPISYHGLMKDKKLMDAKLVLDLPAWDAGYNAGQAGESMNSCPYPIPSRESLSWHAGFIEGKAKRTTAV
jgi:ribosome modulation factor